MVTTVAILGTGTMGQGIAQLAATCGHSARMYDAATDRAQAAQGAILAQLDKLVTKGKLTAEARAQAAGRIQIANDVSAACRDADFIVEAVPEVMDLKVQLMRDVVAASSAQAIFATNTSSLSITELGARIGQPGRTIGLHFFNPPPVMELLEVVRGLSTSEDTLERSLAWAKTLGKTPIIVRDVPGFATSRLGVILGAEAMRMVESGVASVVDIDRAMELGYRHPMGPLKLTDLVGLDVRLTILDHLHRELGEAFRPPPLLRTMVRAGKLGKKSGEGFYRWKDGNPEPIASR